MSRGLLLIDGSNITHAANSATPLTVGDFPTQAIYGVLKTLRPMISTFPMLTPIVLWDGRSWRKDVFKEYKVSRDAPAETKTEKMLAEQRKQFNLQLPFVKLALKTLGVRQMHALNYEADDLAGVIVAKSTEDRRIIMVTADKDWIQLVRKNVTWFDPIHNERLTVDTIPKRLGYNPAKKRLVVANGDAVVDWIGVPSAAAWLDMKCLMGDVSDDIPGVGGIGSKGAIELITQFGSVNGFFNSMIDGSIDTRDMPKKFHDLVVDMEKRDNYQRNMILMDLNTKMRPAPINMATTLEPINMKGFRAICDKFYFKSIIDQFDVWTSPFGVAA